MILIIIEVLFVFFTNSGNWKSLIFPEYVVVFMIIIILLFVIPIEVNRSEAKWRNPFLIITNKKDFSTTLEMT